MKAVTRLTRRQALVTGAIALGTPALAAAPTAGKHDLPWIDAHSHIWPPETDMFPLVNGQSQKNLNPASFTDDELMAIARPEGVGRVVLIQHSTYHLFDNSYLIDAVRRHPKLFRVVGMIDDRKPQPGKVMKTLLPRGVTGFRITPFVLQEKPAEWLDGPGMNDMWHTGAETRQAMCCLINATDLPGIDRMCERFPDTPVVIDHFARIGADGQMRDAELNNLCRLARHTQTSIKISACYFLGEKKPPHSELIPMIKRIYDAFGPQRMMWGSDSPYQLQGVNNYSASIGLIRDRIDFFTPEDREWLLWKTAESLFFHA